MTVVPPAVGLDWVHAIAKRRQRPISVEARDLGIRYDLRFRADRSIGQALREVLVPRPPSHVWALRHINLTVRAGDCLAVVGHNGAGKSTLLQVVTGLLPPDEGHLRARGRISALLNLGVGFDPRLTGRENIDLMGALMGLPPALIRERMDEVITFAGLGRFIDAPLRTYSSGMRARLGFSASTMIDPDVLVLDEVLGTGDASFREVSRARINDLVAEAHAVIAATHDMTWVTEFATYAVLLDGGRIMAAGAPSAVAALHRSRSFKPPRTYDCPTCADEQFGGYCPRCGLRRLAATEEAG
jgi:ABC-type polysaccharide/polyol phosphate transport system ATPase subunit